MYNGFIEREHALAICPNAWCRRGGRCAAITGGQPAYRCLRTHEDVETARNNLADKLDMLMATFPRDPNRKKLTDYELDVALGELKQEINALDAEFTEKRMAAEAKAAAAAKAAEKRAAKALAASSPASALPPPGAVPHPRRGGTIPSSPPRHRGSVRAPGDTT